ncbi:MAG: DciA family protein [Phycisphaeraceae bacterium]
MADDPRQRHLDRLRQWRNRGEPDYSMRFIEKQFQHEVARPHKQLGRFIDLWAELVPETLHRHTRLEGFSRGTLRVAVDSSAHLYELNQLLRGGLERELMRRQPGGTPLRRVRLRVSETTFTDESA